MAESETLAGTATADVLEQSGYKHILFDLDKEPKVMYDALKRDLVGGGKGYFEWDNLVVAEAIPSLIGNAEIKVTQADVDISPNSSNQMIATLKLGIKKGRHDVGVTLWVMNSPQNDGKLDVYSLQTQAQGLARLAGKQIQDQAEKDLQGPGLDQNLKRELLKGLGKGYERYQIGLHLTDEGRLRVTFNPKSEVETARTPAVETSTPTPAPKPASRPAPATTPALPPATPIIESAEPIFENNEPILDKPITETPLEAAKPSAAVAAPEPDLKPAPSTVKPVGAPAETAEPVHKPAPRPPLLRTDRPIRPPVSSQPPAVEPHVAEASPAEVTQDLFRQATATRPDGGNFAATSAATTAGKSRPRLLTRLIDRVRSVASGPAAQQIGDELGTMFGKREKRSGVESLEPPITPNANRKSGPVEYFDDETKSAQPAAPVLDEELDAEKQASEAATNQPAEQGEDLAKLVEDLDRPSAASQVVIDQSPTAQPKTDKGPGPSAPPAPEQPKAGTEPGKTPEDQRKLDKERERLLGMWIDFDEIMKDSHDEDTRVKSVWSFHSIGEQRENRGRQLGLATAEYRKYRSNIFPEIDKIGEVGSYELDQFLKEFGADGRDVKADYAASANYIDSLENRLMAAFQNERDGRPVNQIEKSDLLRKYQQLLETREKVYREMTTPRVSQARTSRAMPAPNSAKTERTGTPHTFTVMRAAIRPVTSSGSRTEKARPTTRPQEREAAAARERKQEERKSPMERFLQTYESHPEDCIVIESVKDQKPDRLFLFRKRKLESGTYVASQITVYPDSTYSSHAPTILESEGQFEGEFLENFITNVINAQKLDAARLEKLPDDIQKKLKSAKERERTVKK